jgi:hypothetical protein
LHTNHNKNMYRILFISLLIATAAGCKNEDKNNRPDNAIDPSIVTNPITASSDPSAPKDNYPVIKFDKERHDFGSIVEGEKVSFAYTFTNTGKAPLVIRAAQGSCGCTVPEYPKEAIEPGKGGIINVTFNSEGKSGHQEKTVTVISNTMPNTTIIYITGDVTPKQ